MNSSRAIENSVESVAPVFDINLDDLLALDSTPIPVVSGRKRKSFSVSSSTAVVPECSSPVNKYEKFDMMLKEILEENTEIPNCISYSPESISSLTPQSSVGLQSPQNPQSFTFQAQPTRRNHTVHTMDIAAGLKTSRAKNSERLLTLFNHAAACQNATCELDAEPTDAANFARPTFAYSKISQSGPTSSYRQPTTATNCKRMKALIQHTNICQKTLQDCHRCRKIDRMTKFHARDCNSFSCRIRFCPTHKKAFIEEDLRNYETSQPFSN